MASFLDFFCYSGNGVFVKKKEKTRYDTNKEKNDFWIVKINFSGAKMNTASGNFFLIIKKKSSLNVTQVVEMSHSGPKCQTDPR